ncbi:MAG: sulfatase [Acidobacteria bacterium]|nr:sulfatase [Acidobacteriota bacterium]
MLVSCDTSASPSVHSPPKIGLAPEQRPDIVLVSIDSLRADHVGCYGYGRPTTPTIDGLAAQGARFENAVSTTSWTLPAHASLFTGLYSDTHGVVDNGLALSANITTLTEALKGAGYHTAGFFGGPYLMPEFGFGQGFDTYECCMSQFQPGQFHSEDDDRVGIQSFADITGPLTLEKTKAWIDKLDSRPFFLFVHMWDVHYDYIPPPEYARMFDPDYTGTLDGRRLLGNKAIRAGMPQRDLEHLVALYDGEIRYTDDNLARILTELDRAGRLDSALVVVTADHGDEFFEHGQKGHQKTLYDEVLKVPLVIRWPGKIQPRQVADQVRIIDIMPTVLSLAGVQLDSPMDGRDLGPLLRGEPLEPAPALCDLQARGKPRLQAVRTNETKFIKFPTAHWWQFGYQYFDLQEDPGEHEVLPLWSPGLWQARSELKRLRADSIALASRLGGTSAEGPQTLNELKDRLRSLGYVGD